VNLTRWLCLLPILVLTSVDAPRTAIACGGVEIAALGGLQPMRATLAWMESPEGEWSAWGQAQRVEFRFLYPFVKTHPELQPLWDFSHDSQPTVAAPNVSPFENALRAGDRKAAKAAAQQIVNDWYALPPVPAAAHADVFWRAIEYLELEPKLGNLKKDALADYFSAKPSSKLVGPLRQASDVRAATPGPNAKSPPKSGANHPRAGSLELWAMQREFRAKVPDGYRDALQKQVSAATWRALEQQADRWQKAHAMHPLADLVTLWKMRIRYFSGDDSGAWQLLFDMYPRRRARVLAEMRFLLLQDRLPTSAQIDQLKDGELIAGLAGPKTIDEARFDRWWALAETSTQPWAANLEERLLLWAALRARTNPLPARFPEKNQNPTQLWGKLRFAALVEARRWKSAREALLSLKADPEQARLATQYFVARKRPELALELPKLGADEKQYLSSVLCDDRALGVLEKSKSSSARKSARFERAVRLAASGKWRAASKLIEKDDPARTKLWRKAATLSEAGDKKLVEYARFLREHHGKLLYAADRGFYRGVSLRYDALPAKSPERQQIENALTRSSERWLALEAYARWLGKHANEAKARGVLAEADAVYNLLVNWAGGDYYFWGKHAAKLASASELRRLGKSIRATRP
jgi:hypothetical protein